MIHLFIFDDLFIIINYLIYIFYKFLHHFLDFISLSHVEKTTDIIISTPFYNFILTYPILTYHVARPLALPRAQRAISGIEHVCEAD